MKTKNIYKFYVSFVLLAVSIGACSDNSDTVQKTSENDQNEILNYIRTTYPSDEILQKALIHRVTLFEHIISNPADALQIQPDLEKSRRCVWYLHPDNAPEINRSIAEKFFNTKSRIKAYATFNKLLSGNTFAQVDEVADDCNP